MVRVPDADAAALALADADADAEAAALALADAEADALALAEEPPEEQALIAAADAPMTPATVAALRNCRLEIPDVTRAMPIPSLSRRSAFALPALGRRWETTARPTAAAASSQSSRALLPQGGNLCGG